ncbi:MAG: hypothetical protein ACRD1B_06660 [Thermoanaerobaculia bacterium]
MIPELRRSFNAAFTEERYAATHRRLERRLSCQIHFRMCETPVFLPRPLRDEMVRSAGEILAQLATPVELAVSRRAIPPGLDVPGEGPHPFCAQVDFGVVEEGGRLVARLIELQAFPSLYGFQFVQAQEQRADCPDGEGLDFLLSDLDEDGYVRVVGEAITNGHPKENVVLLDIDPPTQKTYPDFAATQMLWGIRSVCPTKVEKRGRELWYDRDGRPTRILRIYNRVIFDELLGKSIELPFSFTDPLEVEWAGHPNWYFRWSKHSLPRLKHTTVPEAHFLSDLSRWPDDLTGWVLKPLFSFAGSGVRVDITAADLDAIPRQRRKEFLLMRKVAYAEAVASPYGGGSKVEVRVMFLWKDGKPLPVTTLARLSQGKMMGVAFNKDKKWVGSSSCLWPIA